MRTLTLILFAVLLVSRPHTARTQSLLPQELIRHFSDPPDLDFHPEQIIATRDGGFLIAGYHGKEGMLMKLSACGEVLWRNHYLLGTETALLGVTELPGGALVAVGSCSRCVAADTTQKALAVQTSAAGEVLQHTTLGHSGFNAEATAVITTASGKPAVAGSAVWAAFLGPRNAFLAVLDAQLQTEIWKEYDHFYYDRAQALIQRTDGGFALAGRSSPQLFAPDQAQLFVVDAAGALLWKATSPRLNSRFNSIAEGPARELVALGERLVDTLRKWDAFIAVHDGHQGSLVLEKHYGSADNDRGLSIFTVDGGYLASGIWGTPRQDGWSWRDWVFRLDEDFAVAEEHFRDGYLFGHDQVNVVPLSPDGAHFAFFSRIVFFGSRYNLFYKRTPQGRHLQVAEAAQHHQLFPRDLNSNLGTVRYSGGQRPGSPPYEAVRLLVSRNGQPYLTMTGNAPESFSFSADIEAEPADYHFRLEGIRAGKAYLEAEACDVVTGDAYLIQGQSNAAAQLPYDPADTIETAYDHHRHPFVRNFGLKQAGDTVLVWRKEAGDHSDYADNLSGQWGLVLGAAIVEQQGIPVAIINGGISGISIDSMMPHPADPFNTTRSYGRFLRRVDRSGLRGHARALIMFQGETNAAGGFWDSAEKYYDKFVRLDQAWQADLPAPDRRYLFQIRPGAYWAGATLLTSLQVEEAQRRIAEQQPAWQIMSSTGMNHDGTHYYYRNGYERAGRDLYRLMAYDLYDHPLLPNSHPPTPDSAWFSTADQKEITLQLRHPEDQYVWRPGWEADFRLEGAPEVQVTAGKVIGNRLVLALSAAPGAEFTGLSYTAHPIGDQAPLKNANGVGMLTFYNFPVSPLLTASAGSRPVGDFSIFPNPCRHTLVLSVPPGAEGNADWIILDQAGRQLRRVVTRQPGNQSVDVTGLPAGIYRLRLIYKRELRNFSLIKL